MRDNWSCFTSGRGSSQVRVTRIAAARIVTARGLLAVVVCSVLSGCSGMRARVDGEMALELVRRIRSAEQTFRQQHARYGEWKELIDAGLLPGPLADGVEVGHRFQLKASEKHYASVAFPVKKDDALAYVGWSLYLDESGVIRGCPYGRSNGYVTANQSDRPVGTQ